MNRKEKYLLFQEILYLDVQSMIALLSLETWRMSCIFIIFSHLIVDKI